MGHIYGFGAIAALIVLIACINYVNLATARAIARAREISIRKVMGAMRSQLMVQFIAESVIMALLALALAFAAIELLLPAFDGLIGRAITYNVVANWPLTLAILAVAIIDRGAGRYLPGFHFVRLSSSGESEAVGQAVRRFCVPCWWCCNSRFRLDWASPQS